MKSARLAVYLRARQALACALSFIDPVTRLDLTARPPAGPPPILCTAGSAAAQSTGRASRLYPDSLVALVLTASTYPQQVTDANNWMHQNGGMPPAQLRECREDDAVGSEREIAHRVSRCAR